MCNSGKAQRLQVLAATMFRLDNTLRCYLIPTFRLSVIKCFAAGVRHYRSRPMVEGRWPCRCHAGTADSSCLEVCFL